MAEIENLTKEEVTEAIISNSDRLEELTAEAFNSLDPKEMAESVFNDIKEQYPTLTAEEQEIFVGQIEDIYIKLGHPAVIPVVSETLLEIAKQPDIDLRDLNSDTAETIAKEFMKNLVTTQANLEIELNRLKQERDEIEAELEKGKAELKRQEREAEERKKQQRELAKAARATTPRALHIISSAKAVNAILEVLMAGGRLNEYTAMRKEQLHEKGKDISLDVDENARLLTMTNNKGKLTLFVKDIREWQGRKGDRNRKIFVFLLIKINEQALTNKGEIKSTDIVFNLQELVDKGIYKNKDTARKALKKAIILLHGLMINDEGYTRKGADSSRALFNGIDIVNSVATVEINKNFNWRLLTQAFTRIPDYYFRLSEKSSDLLLYVFVQARQNIELVADQGYFTLGLRAVQNRLFLPDEKVIYLTNDNGDFILDEEGKKKTKPQNNPRRNVIEPILEAVDKINHWQKITYNDTALNLEIFVDGQPLKDLEKKQKLTATEILDNGYIIAEMNDYIAEPFITEAERQRSQEEKRIERKAKKEKLELAKAEAETAKAKAEALKLEAARDKK